MTAKSPLEIDCRTVAERLAAGGHFLLIDCREQEEYDRVHIAGAKLVPMSQLADQVGELEPYRNWDLAVHCHHGGRSLRVVQWLQEQGFAVLGAWPAALINGPSTSIPRWPVTDRRCVFRPAEVESQEGPSCPTTVRWP